MADFNEDFKIVFRNYVLEDLPLTVLIENRFYGSQLATLYDPTFPLAVFWPDIGAPIANGRVQKFNLNVRAYSEITYDEAYSIYTLVRNRLDDKVIEPRIVIRPVTTPNELYEANPRIYSVGSRFLVHWIPE